MSLSKTGELRYLFSLNPRALFIFLSLSGLTGEAKSNKYAYAKHGKFYRCPPRE